MMLYEGLAEALKYNDVEIPSYIAENLSKELREYQKKALKHYFLQRKKPRTNHLMFNMATGSGKTLIMAALMLWCYKNGYRNFVFFVNSLSILEKTKENFASPHSHKYLFNKEIILDGKRVAINYINSLDESKEGAINIYFTTIQSLFSLFTTERENALTLQDLVGEKLVFLADEAHHLNSDTKKTGLNKCEQELKQGWEAVIQKAYESNSENLMLEFSATIPKFKEVQDKYADKIVYQYDLKAFCQAGYSKRIFLLTYENDDLYERFLGAVLLSLYRELLAQKQGLYLKPVILFKSDFVKASKDYESAFVKFVEFVDKKRVERFYSHISQKDELLYKSLIFFKGEYGESFGEKIATFIKQNFKRHYILNANDENEVGKNQILLNCLESRENHIRIIFAVDKLNEGWDVLNLFDIVRLGVNKKTKAATTKEVQLIGRGARYYPLDLKGFDETMRYKRKFDNDLDNELSSLERLTYHALYELEFIKNLNESMREQNLFIEDSQHTITLTPNKDVLDKVQEDKVFYANNRRTQRKNLLNYKISKEELAQEIRELTIPLISNAIHENEEKFEKFKQNDDFFVPKSLENIAPKYFLKAMNVLGIGFRDLSEFGSKSKRDFICNYLGNISVCFHKNQQFNATYNLTLAIYILEHFKSVREKIKNEYEVSEFEINELELKERVLLTSKESKKVPYEWLLYNDILKDSSLELQFFDFIESEKERLNNAFSKWFVVRNDGFNEFKIYDNRKNANGKRSETYARGFEPDFILFAKRKGSAEIFSIECFIEVKGGHLADSWKEDFLRSIQGIKAEVSAKGFKTHTINLQSLPFFKILHNKNIDKNFIESFETFLKTRL